MSSSAQAIGDDDWWVRAPETARLRTCIVAGEDAIADENAGDAT